MRRLLVFSTTTFVAVALAASVATAGEPRPTGEPVARGVLECRADAATRRAFLREHGQPPVFVTVEDVRAARASGQTWSVPRCMTAREIRRLETLTPDYARAR